MSMRTKVDYACGANAEELKEKINELIKSYENEGWNVKGNPASLNENTVLLTFETEVKKTVSTAKNETVSRTEIPHDEVIISRSDRENYNKMHHYP